MKLFLKIGSFIAIIVLVALVVGFFGTVSTNSTPVCHKIDGQIGTCAQIHASHNLLGMRQKYEVKTTPTNSSEFENSDRFATHPLEAACAEGQPELSFQNGGLEVKSAQKTCFIEFAAENNW